MIEISSDDSKSNGNSEVQFIAAINKNQGKPTGSPKTQTKNSKLNGSDIIMIDVESENTQQSNSKSVPVVNLEDDEWMSDDNLDEKIGILRKQIQSKSSSSQQQ